MELLRLEEELDGVGLDVHEGDEGVLNINQVVLRVLLLQSFNHEVDIKTRFIIQFCISTFSCVFQSGPRTKTRWRFKAGINLCMFSRLEYYLLFIDTVFIAVALTAIH